jgi:hypothetical protein
MTTKNIILTFCDEEELQKIEPVLVLEGYDVINLKELEELSSYMDSPEIKCIFVNHELIEAEKFENMKNIPFPVIILFRKKNEKLKEKFISMGFEKTLEFENNGFEVQEKIEKILQEI